MRQILNDLKFETFEEIFGQMAQRVYSDYKQVGYSRFVQSLDENKTFFDGLKKLGLLFVYCDGTGTFKNDSGSYFCDHTGRSTGMIPDFTQ